MPDHLHIIVMVNEGMEEGKHVRMVVRGFKAGCSRPGGGYKTWGNASGTEASSYTGLLQRFFLRFARRGLHFCQ